MVNINQLKQAISKLDEQEAKSLLALLLIRTEQCNEEEVVPILQELKKSLIQASEAKPEVDQYQTIHIAFGDSTGGSLKAAFRETSHANTEGIIVLPDILSVGPLDAFQTIEGINNRSKWFSENFRADLHDLEGYKQRMMNAIETIKGIQPHQQVIIWTCENAAEQTGLRLVLYLLDKKLNEVCELNTFKAFHELYTYPMLEEQEPYPRTSGELNPEQLLQFYQRYELRPLNAVSRQALSDEGRNLLLIENSLRTWEHGEIWHANIDRDDDFIIQCAKKLHKEQSTYDYMKAARLIGEVIGYMEQYTGDGWIEYRLRALIEQGIFDYKGKLNGMRFYEVKLKEELLQVHD